MLQQPVQGKANVIVTSFVWRNAARHAGNDLDAAPASWSWKPETSLTKRDKSFYHPWKLVDFSIFVISLKFAAETKWIYLSHFWCLIYQFPNLIIDSYLPAFPIHVHSHLGSSTKFLKNVRQTEPVITDVAQWLNVLMKCYDCLETLQPSLWMVNL